MADREHAIIGCGRVAPNHVDGFGAVPGWSVTYACDRQEHAPAFAQRYRIPKWRRDHRAVFADPRVTSVSICVDHAGHADLVRQALEADKHVLVEKPVCLDVAEATELVELARRRSLVLSVVAQHRYDPLVLAVREWVRLGLLGKVLFVAMSLQSHRSPNYYTDSYWRGTDAGEGGSALINQGYHLLDTVRWVCGDFEVHAAMTRTQVLGHVLETEETLSGIMAVGAAPATINVTVASRVEFRTLIEIAGSRGSVTFDLGHPNRLHQCVGGDELERRAEDERRRPVPEPPPGIGYYGISHRRQVADFCRAVDTGAPMLCPADDAVRTLQTILELYAAADAAGTP